MIHAYGDKAGPEAATRAAHSRDVGNLLHFCRWRQVERLIAMLVNDDLAGTLH